MKHYFLQNILSVVKQKRYIHFLLGMGLFFAVSMESYAGVKWHPGHYLHAMTGKKKGAFTFAANESYKDLEDNAIFAGLELRFKWADLETSKGVYNFKALDEHLSRLSTMGTRKKRLFIILETRSFDTTTALVPCYLISNQCAGYVTGYEGGIFPYKKTETGSHFGNGIRLWKVAVRDRMIALMKALGNRYNAHTHFEGIGLGETAMGIPLSSANVSSQDITNYYEGLITIHKAMRVAFPNTITTQFTNAPRSMMSYFIGKMIENGMALGGPDVLIDDYGMNAKDIPNQQDGVYTYYPKLSGDVALTPSIMSTNYERTSIDGRTQSHVPTIDELLDFSRDNLKATHLFWTRDDKGHYKEAITVLTELKANNDPRFYLNLACPTKYQPCIK